MNIPGDDGDLSRALLDVNLPNLLMVISCITGSDEWLTERFAPAPIEAPEGSLFAIDDGGYSDEIAAEIRALAVRVIGELRDGKRTLAPLPDKERFKKIMSFSVADQVDDGYADMLMEEMRFVDRDLQWRGDLDEAVAAGKAENFNVVIIGAGMSGLGTAAKLKAAGIEFTIFEKNPEVGGTWYENTYPDCGVDTPNHYYSYSFNRNPNWSGYFSKRDELFEYFDHCADEFGVRDNIRFNTEVVRAVYDNDEHVWRVTSMDAGGTEQTTRANVVISAVGQLNRPVMPDIEGLNSFAGPKWHSARWQAQHDLHGKRVGVIGTGCSCVQLLPKTAEVAERAIVFQRSPHWVSPARDYYRPVESGQLWALNHIPYYAEFHRARMIWSFGDRVWPAVVADPDWKDADTTLNEMNQGMRDALIEFIKEGLGDKTEYIEKCVPDFPVWGKRLIVDNGWYPTLARENVDLVTDPIVRITPQGVETADGKLHELDVLILATGFNTNHFLWPIEVVGKSGRSLEEIWGDSANAYKGVSVPDFPNLFCLYGPNTNIVHGGSIIYQVECQIHYVMQCITALLDKDVDAIDVRADVNEGYNDEVQAISRTLAWGHPNVESWYKNSAGRVVNNSPFSLQKYWAVTHQLDLNDYHLDQTGDNEAA